MSMYTISSDFMKSISTDDWKLMCISHDFASMVKKKKNEVQTSSTSQSTSGDLQQTTSILVYRSCNQNGSECLKEKPLPRKKKRSLVNETSSVNFGSTDAHGLTNKENVTVSVQSEVWPDLYNSDIVKSKGKKETLPTPPSTSKDVIPVQLFTRLDALELKRKRDTCPVVEGHEYCAQLNMKQNISSKISTSVANSEDCMDVDQHISMPCKSEDDDIPCDIECETHLKRAFASTTQPQNSESSSESILTNTQVSDQGLGLQMIHQSEFKNQRKFDTNPTDILCNLSPVIHEPDVMSYETSKCSDASNLEYTSRPPTSKDAEQYVHEMFIKQSETGTAKKDTDLSINSVPNKREVTKEKMERDCRSEENTFLPCGTPFIFLPVYAPDASNEVFIKQSKSERARTCQNSALSINSMQNKHEVTKEKIKSDYRSGKQTSIPYATPYIFLPVVSSTPGLAQASLSSRTRDGTKTVAVGLALSGDMLSHQQHKATMSDTIPYKSDLIQSSEIESGFPSVKSSSSLNTVSAHVRLPKDSATSNPKMLPSKQIFRPTTSSNGADAGYVIHQSEAIRSTCAVSQTPVSMISILPTTTAHQNTGAKPSSFSNSCDVNSASRDDLPIRKEPSDLCQTNVSFSSESPKCSPLTYPYSQTTSKNRVGFNSAKPIVLTTKEPISQPMVSILNNKFYNQASDSVACVEGSTESVQSTAILDKPVRPEQGGLGRVQPIPTHSLVVPGIPPNSCSPSAVRAAPTLLSLSQIKQEPVDIDYERRTLIKSMGNSASVPHGLENFASMIQTSPGSKLPDTPVSVAARNVSTYNTDLQPSVPKIKQEPVDPQYESHTLTESIQESASVPHGLKNFASMIQTSPGSKLPDTPVSVATRSVSTYSTDLQPSVPQIKQEPVDPQYENLTLTESIQESASVPHGIENLAPSSGCNTVPAGTRADTTYVTDLQNTPLYIDVQSTLKTLLPSKSLTPFKSVAIRAKQNPRYLRVTHKSIRRAYLASPIDADRINITNVPAAMDPGFYVVVSENVDEKLAVSWAQKLVELSKKGGINSFFKTKNNKPSSPSSSPLYSSTSKKIRQQGKCRNTGDSEHIRNKIHPAKQGSVKSRTVKETKAKKVSKTVRSSPVTYKTGIEYLCKRDRSKRISLNEAEFWQSACNLKLQHTVISDKRVRQMCRVILNGAANDLYRKTDMCNDACREGIIKEIFKKEKRSLLLKRKYLNRRIKDQKKYSVIIGSAAMDSNLDNWIHTQLQEDDVSNILCENPVGQTQDHENNMLDEQSESNSAKPIYMDLAEPEVNDHELVDQDHEIGAKIIIPEEQDDLDEMLQEVVFQECDESKSLNVEKEYLSTISDKSCASDAESGEGSGNLSPCLVSLNPVQDNTVTVDIQKNTTQTKPLEQAALDVNQRTPKGYPEKNGENTLQDKKIKHLKNKLIEKIKAVEEIRQKRQNGVFSF